VALAPRIVSPDLRLEAGTAAPTLRAGSTAAGSLASSRAGTPALSPSRPGTAKALGQVVLQLPVQDEMNEPRGFRASRPLTATGSGSPKRPSSPERVPPFVV
jgi:hypothetical protein